MKVVSRMASDTIRVYDTWVTGKNGRIHFDVMTTDETTALKLANEYLVSIGEPTTSVTTKECQFCHSEPLFMFSPEQQKQVKEKGGFIVPMPA